MSLFNSGRSHDSPRLARLYAAYEIAYTGVDFTAAALFVVGSVMFFSEEWQTAGTWCFLIGSICFAAKPTLRLVREVHYARIGGVEALAERARHTRDG
jgi:uncharacterized membrane protein YgdD (TMEM256/DUF423 family)